MDNDLSLSEINRERGNLGLPREPSEFRNVFMRSLPGQMVLTFAFSVAAATSDDFDFVIPQRRGNAQAIRPIFTVDTLANIETDTFTLTANGVEIYTDDCVAYYTPIFDSYLDKRQYVTIPENSTINININHAAGVGILTGFIQTFYAPKPVLPPASALEQR